MNCCKSFQSKHGQPWPRKGESWFLSTSDSFTKMPQNVMREEFVLQSCNIQFDRMRDMNLLDHRQPRNARCLLSFIDVTYA